jgi:hypothetical protein
MKKVKNMTLMTDRMDSLVSEIDHPTKKIPTTSILIPAKDPSKVISLEMRIKSCFHKYNLNSTFIDLLRCRQTKDLSGKEPLDYKNHM